MPANVASMIAAGERPAGCPRCWNASRNTAKGWIAIKKSTSLLEPVLIIVMGLLVGAVAIALLLPIFRMGSVVAG